MQHKACTSSDYVSALEALAIKHRTKAGIYYHGWFALGYMALACLAYFVRDHKHLQLYMGLSSLFFLPYWWYEQE